MILSNAADLRVGTLSSTPNDGCTASGFSSLINIHYPFISNTEFNNPDLSFKITKDGSSNGGVANSWAIRGDDGEGGWTTERVSNTGGDWPWLVSWPNGGVVQKAALQATAAIENSDSSVFYVYPETTISRAISGSKQLVKYGSGVLKLNGTNTYTGNTTISSGTLEIAGSGSLGSGSYNGSITNNGTLRFTSSTPQTLTGNISGSGSIVATGGLLTLRGDSVFSGGVSTSTNGRLYLTNSRAAGSGNITLGSNVIANTTLALGISGGITVNNPINRSVFSLGSITSFGSGNNHFSGGISGNMSNDLNIANGQTSGNLTISNGINCTNTSLSLSGSLSANAGFINGPIIISPTGTLYNSGVTSWTLNTSAGNSYGFTAVRNRGNIIIGTNNALLTTSRINFDTSTSTGYIDLNGYNQAVRGVASVAGTSGGNGGIITNRGNSNATLSLAGTTANLTYNGTITDGPTNKVNVVLNISGRTQIFNGSNTYTGTTTISAGTLQIGTITTGSLSLSSNIINNGTLTFNRTGTVESGSISGTGNLIKLGTGTLNLSGTNSYTGSTAVNAGTLRLNSLVSGPTGKFSLATFSTTVLSAAFISPPSATETYRLLAGSTTNTYAASAVKLVGATGRTGTYNSANSTLTIA